MDIKVFAERLKDLRAEKKLSARKLGKEAGISDASIIDWENGKRIPSADSILKLALYFKVSTDYFYGLSDQ